jgi:predicted signal transduction protein with EAL and GGDEF domain
MYRAKRRERGSFFFFESRMEADLLARAALEADLRRALAGEEIKPYFEPIIDLDSRQPIGFEILARWHHPAKGVLPPDLFITILEDLGLISKLTYSLLRQACREAREWPHWLRLSLNVSPLQLRDPLLPIELLAVLSETGFAAGRLDVEITENSLVEDPGLARSILISLQGIGMKIALDDFGTGFSSLGHLRQMPFDKLKIDRSFVQSMATDPESEKIVGAILGLAASMGLPVIAEGIESDAILLRLLDAGCRYGQGHWLGMPMTAKEAAQLVRAPASGAAGAIAAAA